MQTYIGIDPGRHTGIATAVDGQLIDLFTTDFWGAIDFIDNNRSAIFVVELPRNKHVFHNGATQRGAIERTGVNVGSVIREAELLIQYLGRIQAQVIIQAPDKGRTKWNAYQFEILTGWHHHSNQHERDAALLVYGLGG